MGTKTKAQMLEMTVSGYVGEGSPDRVDALVWCLSDLMLTAQGPTFIFDGVGPRRDELEIARHAYNTDHYRRD